MEYYKQTTEATLEGLKSTRHGLSSEEVNTRLETYGHNVIEVAGEPWWKKLIEPFRSIFMLILAIAAGISLYTQHYTDAYIIIAIILISAGIYYVQRASTERVLKSLKKYEAADVEVFRGGKSLQVPIEDIVPGDIVRLYEGQKVPADARILEADNVRVDEAMLTGESEPISKQTEALEGDHPVYERVNMLFQGSFLTSGEATAVITQTGNLTEFGRLAVLSQDGELSSPVQEKIDKLISQIVAVVAGIATVILALSLLRGIELAEAFHFMLAISVSVIPEGLPIAISVILVLGMRRMAQRKALVRNMAAIENIGLITTIASDKTGTLTKNQLEVDQVWHLYDDKEEKETALHLMLSANQKEGVSHDPLDSAFAHFASNHETSTESFTHIRSLPFDQLLAMSGNVWKQEGTSWLYLKGSPERILRNTSLSDEEHKKVEDQLHELTTQGLRVIALARIKDSDVESLEELEDTQMEFLALLAVADELRPEAKESILKAQGAGVTVRMITGDHFETAFSIGKQLGLCETREQVFDSREMADMSDEELSETVARSRVFARVIPEHKHRILTVLKEQDITAMTGDGVNDVPALTNAHIGLSMGSGSQIAQDAGDIILLDDNFSSITAALEEGRKIFDNIRRMLFLLLTTNAGEALTIMMALVLGVPMPVLAVQILWINLVTDSAMVIPLGLEPGEDDLMDRKPRNPKQPILGKIVITRMILIASVMAIVTLGFFTYFLQFTSEEYARTIAFSVLVVMQWADAFNARSLWQSIFFRIRVMNKSFYVGLFIAISMHLIALFGPMQGALSLEAISASHFFITTAVAMVAVIIAGEIHKLIMRRIDPDFR